MLRIFQRIRIKLLSSRQIQKYSLYALGEIALVVIGILIALQINTWNQNRLNKLEEKNILKNLKDEFLLNKDQFIKSLNRIERALSTSKKLSGLIGSDRRELETQNLDSLIYNVFEYDNLTISENTLLDLIQSGRLHLISNESLKNSIYQWTQQTSLVQENYELARKKSAFLLTYLSPRYSLKNVDIYGGFEWQKMSRLPNDRFLIFSELEFENLLEDTIYSQYVYLSTLKKIEKIIDAIISEINI